MASEEGKTIMQQVRLTARQQEVVNIITDHIKTFGYAPSVTEICKKTGLSSTSTVHSHLVKLEKKGVIERRRNCPRGIGVVQRQPTTVVGTKYLDALEELHRLVMAECENYLVMAMARVIDDSDRGQVW